MAEVIQDSPQEFWRSPTVPDPAAAAILPIAPRDLAEACADCRSEFMIGARFCHTCGLRRPLLAETSGTTVGLPGLWTRAQAWLRLSSRAVADAWQDISFPAWMQYLHFHEIQRLVGLPTAALIAFLVGLGCVAGAIGVSLFYKASNLAEFQAVQMWRIEWLLAATASFVAGILLKKSDT